jgi:hypothetical protein
MRALSATIAFLVVVAPPTTGRANYTFQGIVGVSGGYTSNASGGAANSPDAQPDALILVTPGVVFTSALARAIQRLSYNFSAQFYAKHPDLATLSNRLDWNGLFQPSRTTELVLNSYVLQSRLNSATPDSLGQLTRVGTQTYWSVGLTEALLWTLSPQLRLTQNLSFNGFLPTTDAIGQSYTTTAGVGLLRVFRRDSFGADFQFGDYFYREARGPITNPDGTVDPHGIVTPSRDELSAQLMLRWRRDLGVFWNINLGFGAATLFRATDGGGRIWQPVGEAGVHYVHPRIQLALTYARSLTPSPIVQSTFVTDNVGLHALLPFGFKSHVNFTGGGSYVHFQDADTFTGNLSTKVDLFLVDAALDWMPRDWLSVFTRYTYSNQLASTQSNPPVASIERHIFLVGLSIVYPPQGAALVPKSSPIRVDRSDAVDIPDLHAPSEK